MEQGQDHSPSQPSPRWLQEQTRRLVDELRPWRLVICTTTLSASATSAERFQLSDAWGRRLTINGFDPRQDVLDLKGFWAEGQQARVVATPGGASVLLDFNAQQVLLPGVDPGALTSAVMQTWPG
jgi:hypothetical protein